MNSKKSEQLKEGLRNVLQQMGTKPDLISELHAKIKDTKDEENRQALSDAIDIIQQRSTDKILESLGSNIKAQEAILEAIKAIKVDNAIEVELDTEDIVQAIEEGTISTGNAIEGSTREIKQAVEQSTTGIIGAIKAWDIPALISKLAKTEEKATTPAEKTKPIDYMGMLSTVLVSIKDAWSGIKAGVEIVTGGKTVTKENPLYVYLVNSEQTQATGKKKIGSADTIIASGTGNNALIESKLTTLNTTATTILTGVQSNTTAITDNLSQYKVNDLDDVSNPRYYGYVEKGGAWYILKEDISAKTYRYTKGTSGYTTAWANRASQTYDYYDNTF